ncbi:hypothetical protein RJ639_047817, partial [Escallonia herrerae]
MNISDVTIELHSIRDTFLGRRTPHTIEDIVLPVSRLIAQEDGGIIMYSYIDTINKGMGNERHHKTEVNKSYHFKVPSDLPPNTPKKSVPDGIQAIGDITDITTHRHKLLHVMYRPTFSYVSQGLHPGYIIFFVQSAVMIASSRDRTIHLHVS